MKKLKIGVLGASRGMDFVNKILLDYDYAEIFAICESYSALAEKTEKLLAEKGKNIKCYSDYDEFINCGIEAVILCNFANKHVEFAIKALNNGIHVLSDSLPTQTVAEAVSLCEAVEKSGCVYAYGENYCYFDNNFKMRQIYESGIIGEAACIEGDFINDCSPRWELLTRGERNHWRNYVPSTFYCTHSIGPMLFSTNTKALRVNGFETPRLDYMAENGARSGSAAMEILQLDNGAVAKSMNGNYAHSYRADYRIIGTKGSIIANTLENFVTVILRQEDGGYSTEKIEAKPYEYKYRPKGDLGVISNSDLLLFGFFIGRILGDREAEKYSIDVYRALDMSLPGLLAYRSILNNSNTFEVPDFRNKEIREKYKNDHYSTDPESEAEFLLPTNKNGTPDVEESIYTKVKEKFCSANLKPGMN